MKLATQTTRKRHFCYEPKTLDQLERTGVYDHVIKQKAAIIDMGLENIKDVGKPAEVLPLAGDGVQGLGFQTKLKNGKEKNNETKDLVPELESRKFKPKQKRSSTDAIQYGEKQSVLSDSTHNFNTMTYSGDFRTP